MRIHHLALRVLDLERSARFYVEVLGLRVLQRKEDATGPRAIWLAAGDAVVMLERSLRGAGPEAGSAHLVAFEVAGLAEWERRLAEAGVAVDDRTPHSLYVRDPDGHRVGLTTFPAPG